MDSIWLGFMFGVLSVIATFGIVIFAVAVSVSVRKMKEIQSGKSKK